MEPLRLQLRSALSAMLGFVPDDLVQRLRRAHRLSPPASLRHRLYSGILQVVRHRHLDAGIEFVRIDEFGLLLYNDNSVLTKRLFYFGEYESSEAYWWKYFCQGAREVVEFGANTGFYSIIGARVPGVVRYTAVEPHPRCAEVLRRNLSINGIHQVEVIEAAVVGKAESERQELWIPLRDADMTPTGGSLALGQPPDGRAREKIPVRLVEARQYLEGADLIKMDIEGQEQYVLEAAQDILAKRRPTIFAEVLRRNVRLREYIPELCRHCGYDVFAIAEDGLHSLPPSEVPRRDHYQEFGTRDLILTVSTSVPTSSVVPKGAAP